MGYSVLPQASDSKQHQKIQNTKTSFLDMKTLKVIFVCILMPFFVLGSESEVVDEHEEDKRASFNDMLSRSLRSSVSDYQQRPNTNHAIEMWTLSLRSHPTDMFTRALRSPGEEMWTRSLRDPDLLMRALRSPDMLMRSLKKRDQGQGQDMWMRSLKKKSADDMWMRALYM